MRLQNENFRQSATKGIFALFLLLASFTYAPIIAAAGSNTAPIKLAAGAFDQSASFLNKIGKNAALTDAQENAPSAYVIIGKIINMILSFTGILFLALIIWAGYKWMTAGGKEEKVSTAITIFKESIIGLSIIILTFLFVNYILLQAVHEIIK